MHSGLFFILMGFLVGWLVLVEVFLCCDGLVFVGFVVFFCLGIAWPLLLAVVSNATEKILPSPFIIDLQAPVDHY